MDKIKLVKRTIALLSSMVESGECHTTRSREMKDNAIKALEELQVDNTTCSKSELMNNFFEFYKSKFGNGFNTDVLQTTIIQYLEQSTDVIIHEKNKKHNTAYKQ